MSRLTSKVVCKASGGQSKINKFFSCKLTKETGSSSSGNSSVDSVSGVNIERSNQEIDENMPPKRKSVSKSPDGEPESKKAAVTAPESSGSPAAEQNRNADSTTGQGRDWFQQGLVPAGIGPTWYRALKAEFTKPYFIKLSKFVEEERKKAVVFPPESDVFSWTTVAPISAVKVVILGQDPYHGPNQAHGLCFSVKKGVPPPPSLENMYKELATDIPGFKKPDHGDLTGWAKQGVLLLNAVLTVRQREPNSHKDKGWEQFTDAVITHLNNNTQGLVFILWGAYAQKKGKSINQKKHHVISGAHPSPLSAHKGFFGCKHFSKCNEFLRQEGKEPIDWAKFV